MSGIGSIDGFNPLSFMKSTETKRYAPEPKNFAKDGWASTLVKNLMKMAGEKGLDLAGIDNDYSALLIKQMEMQEQMMLVSMTSNIEKARHETRMASVRNMRVT